MMKSLTEYKRFYRQSLYAILYLIGKDKYAYCKDFYGVMLRKTSASFINEVSNYFFDNCCSPEIRNIFSIFPCSTNSEKMGYTYVLHNVDIYFNKKFNVLSCIAHFKEKIPFNDKNRITMEEFNSYINTLDDYNSVDKRNDE